MKKQIAIVLSIIFLLGVFACGVPNGMDKRTYENGKNAIEIVQNYNKGLVSKDVACDRLKSIEKALDKLDITDASAKSKNSLVCTIIGLLYVQVWCDNDTSDTIKQLKDLGIK